MSVNLGYVYQTQHHKVLCVDRDPYKNDSDSDSDSEFLTLLSRRMGGVKKHRV